MKNQYTIRRLLALLLVLCTLVTLFAGCNDRGEQPTQEPSGTVDNGTEGGDNVDPTDAPTEPGPTTPPTEPEPDPPLDVTEPEPDPEVPMLHLYIAPNGRDSNDGRTEATALASIDGASKLLVASPFAGNVTIHIAEGEYFVAENAYWHYSNPGYMVYIEGAGQDKTVFYGPLEKDVTFLQVSSCNNTSLSFKNFTVRLFRNGIIMRCSADGSVLTNDGVMGWFENLTFTELGGYYTRCDSAAVAGIQFLGSSNNTIKNCTFSGLRDFNTGNNIHGVYISTFSSNNLIQGCVFEDIRPDPVRIRRGSSNNIIEYNSFRNTGVIAYVSDWHAGEAEPEPSEKNVVRYNQFYGGYNGIKISNVCIFKGGTSNPVPLDPALLLDLGNTVHESEFDPVVDAAVKNYMVSVDGEIKDQYVPIYSMDRYDNYIDLDDLAVLLKGTAFAFNYTLPDPEETTVTTVFTVALNNSYTGTELTVQPDAAEGEIQANQAKGWSITNLSKSKGAIYERNGEYYVSMDTMQDLLALSDQTIFQYTYKDGMLCITTEFEHVEVPETIPVYILKLNGSFSQVGSNNGQYSMADVSNFDIITMKTDDLDHLIRFRDLVRDGIDFVIVGIPIGNGTWGVREWKNSTMKDYYYYGTNKLTGLNRTWTDSSNGYSNCFYKEVKNLIYYTIIPVGKPLDKNPQYRIAENWTTGSIHDYSEIFIVDCDKYQPIGDTTKVTVQSVGAKVNGTSKGNVSLLTSALGKTYLNIDDLALLFKGTVHGFTYTVNSASNQITVTKGSGFTGSSFASVAAGTITVKDWKTVTVKVGSNSASVSAFSYNGAWYVDADKFAEVLGAYCSAKSTGINVLLDLNLPETMDVLMLNFSGNLENQDATDVETHKLNLTTASFTSVATSTELLSQYIDLLSLMKDDFKYIIVGIELTPGIWGVREWKNNSGAAYYTNADRKWSTGSGGISDWFSTSEESVIYYTVIPVGEDAVSDPTLRIKQGWEKGSPSAYTQIIFTNCADYTN